MDENTSPTAPIEFDPPIPVVSSEPVNENQEGGQVESTPVEVPTSEVEASSEEKKIEDEVTSEGKEPSLAEQAIVEEGSTLENPTPEALAQAEVVNPPQELAEEKGLDLPESFEPHGQLDPAFNCETCLGEGLEVNTQFPEGRVCLVCKGTGKI